MSDETTTKTGGLKMSDETTAATTKPWQSKTLWCAIFVAAAPMFPPITQVIINNTFLCSALVGSIFGALRFVTSTVIKVK